MSPPLTSPALTDARRAEIEARLAGAKVLGAVFVSETAKVSVQVDLPDGVSDDDVNSIGKAVDATMNALAEVVGAMLPAARESGG